MTNRITITGNLGQDAELKFLDSGRAVLNMSVGDSKSRRDEHGNWHEVRPTIWHRVAVWGAMAETWHQSGLLVKGATVEITGEMHIREYEHNGESRWSSEVTAYQVGVRERRDQQQQSQGGGGGFGQSSGFGEPGGPGTMQPAGDPWAGGGTNDAGGPPF